MPSRDFKRADRVGAQLRRELGVLVHQAVRDDGLPSVSVVDVEVTKDFDSAKVWVMLLDGSQATETLKALNARAGEFRHQLSHSMRMRRVPELHFKYDDSEDRADRIEFLLRDAHDAPGIGNRE